MGVKTVENVRTRASSVQLYRPCDVAEWRVERSHVERCGGLRQKSGVVVDCMQWVGRMRSRAPANVRSGDCAEGVVSLFLLL